VVFDLHDSRRDGREPADHDRRPADPDRNVLPRSRRRSAGAPTRARVFLATDIEAPVRAPVRGEGLLQKLVRPFRDRATWKELLYVWLVQPTQSVVNFCVAVTAWYVPLWALTLPIYATHSPPRLWTGERLDTWHETIPIAIGGMILLPLAPWVVRAFAAADRGVARWGLSGARTAALEDRIDTLRAMQAPW
jgi:hypothetical protein